MSRYLTPSKIGFLALTSLYTESVVPSTATIPVLSFLVFNVLPTTPSTVEKESFQDGSTTTIETFQRVTNALVSGIPGRTVWDLLLNKLWKINSLDALHAFFDGLVHLLQKGPDELSRLGPDNVDANPNRMLLSRVSPLGVFVRRAQIEFTRLQFHDAVTIWKDFIAYRAPTLAQWRKRNPNAGPTSFDINLQADPSGSPEQVASQLYDDSVRDAKKKPVVSTVDVEKLLDHQVERMQRIGIRLPQEIKIQLRAMVETGVTVPSLSHYVEFLDAWRAGDYPSSFDSLHRYFDYTMHNRDRAFYQYALLNLAILHADFDCHSDALTAIQETIASARENNDTACLNYSLSWLFHFGKAHPKFMAEVQKKGILGPDKETVAFLKAKAKETGMWSLLSTSLLSEAKLFLTEGESVSQALEAVLKVSYINLIKNIRTAAGSQMMMQSAIFGRLGVSCQALLTNELFLQCYASQSPIEDTVHCVSQTAFLLSQKGRFDEALTRMEDIDQDVSRPLRNQQLYNAQLGLLNLSRLIYQNHFIAAEHVLAQLLANKNLGNELRFRTQVLEIELKIRRRDYTSAMSLLETLTTSLSSSNVRDISTHIKTMILKARIYAKAGIPQKGFSVSLRAASLALKAKILPLLWESINAITTIFNSLAEYTAAIALLESIVPRVLECEDCALTATTFSHLADAHVGLAGEVEAGTLQRKEQLTKGLENLGWAFEAFEMLGDVGGQCEMLAKQATVMHLNGDGVLANDAAARYLAIKEGSREEY